MQVSPAVANSSNLQDLANQYLQGMDIDWPALHPDHQKRQRVELPTYPFENKRYWVEPPRQGQGKLDLTSPATSSPLRQSLLQLPQPRQLQTLRDYLRQTVSAILGESHLPDIDQGFGELGLHSLRALELTRQLEVDLELSLPATVTFEQPDIESLARYLVEEMNQAGYNKRPKEADVAVPARAMPDEMNDSEAEINQYSVDDLVSMISREFKDMSGE
jgi:acyl transferase domain-containing protein